MNESVQQNAPHTNGKEVNRREKTQRPVEKLEALRPTA